MNFGRSSTLDHCSYTWSIGAFTTTMFCAAFIVSGMEFIARREFSGGEPRVLVSREHPVPSVCEVKEGHVQHEHRIVAARGTPENSPWGPCGISLRLFGFHF